MKQMFLGLTLTLFVCLPARAAQPDAQPAHAPQIGSAVPEFGAMAKKTTYSFAALTLLFLLVTGTFKRFAKQRGTTKSEHEIELLARKPVGQRQSLLLVSVSGQRFLLAQGTDEIRLISDLDDEAAFRSALNDTLAYIENPRKTANEDEG